MCTSDTYLELYTKYQDTYINATSITYIKKGFLT